MEDGSELPWPPAARVIRRERMCVSAAPGTSPPCRLPVLPPARESGPSSSAGATAISDCAHKWATPALDSHVDDC